MQEDVTKLSVHAPDCSCKLAVPDARPFCRVRPPRGSRSHLLNSERALPPRPLPRARAPGYRRIWVELQEAEPGEGKAARKRPGKRLEAAAGGAAPPPPVRAAGASGSSARAAGPLTWHSQPGASEQGVRSRYGYRGRGVPGGACGGLGAGESQVRRVRGAAGVRAAARGCTGTPHQLGSRFPEEERAGNIPGEEDGNSSARLRDIISGKGELVPGDGGQGRVSSVESERPGFGSEAGLVPSGSLPCRGLQLSQVSATWCSG